MTSTNYELMRDRASVFFRWRRSIFHHPTGSYFGSLEFFNIGISEAVVTVKTKNRSRTMERRLAGKVVFSGETGITRTR